MARLPARAPGTLGEEGFSLMEVIVATVIAAIAVIGLAYTFGMGRGLISRFEVARAALASANGHLEALATLAPGDTAFSLGTHQVGFEMGGQPIGLMRWTVTPFDDPSDGLGGADQDSVTEDLRHVALAVTWESNSFADTLTLEREFPRP